MCTWAFAPCLSTVFSPLCMIGLILWGFNIVWTLTTHFTHTLYTHTHAHRLPLWLQQSVRYEPIKPVSLSLQWGRQRKNVFFIRGEMLAQSPSVNSLCAAPLILHLHSVSALFLSPVSALIYSIFLGLVYDLDYFFSFHMRLWGLRSFHPLQLTTKAFFRVDYIPLWEVGGELVIDQCLKSGVFYLDAQYSADNKMKRTEYVSVCARDRNTISTGSSSIGHN